MLGHIIEESNLPMPSQEQHLWAHHGIHLGDWRRRLQQGWQSNLPDAFHQMYMRKMVDDPEFMEIVNKCAPHLMMLKETFKMFKDFANL